MKNFVKLFCLIYIFIGQKTNGQNYLISFEGSGAATIVSSVKVENLASGKSLILNGYDILHLTAIVTGVKSIDNGQLSELKIYPNPMTDYSIMEVFPPIEGDAIISATDIDGKQLAQIQSHLGNLKQTFRISGLKNGFYLINVKGPSYQLSGKLLSNGETNGSINIEKLNDITVAVDEKTVKTHAKGSQATVDMEYTNGDRLKFTGISGNFSTVLTDIPTQDKTITFDFIACTDDDNNSYPVVKIGNQIWMAENLKVTHYNDGTSIPYMTGSSADAYCWYNNDPSTNKNTYGALYNWAAVFTDKLCPTGWHVPSHSEWGTLTTFLGGDSVAGGKLKENGTTHWNTPNTGATNESGFTALPGSMYYEWNYFTFFPLGTNSYFWSRSSPTHSSDYWSYGESLCYNLSNSSDTLIHMACELSVRCLKDMGPSITTDSITNISISDEGVYSIVTAQSGGHNLNDNGSEITHKGLCWSCATNPEVTSFSHFTDEGGGAGDFKSTISMGIDECRWYFVYVRSYATNANGTNYGNEILFQW
jgi:uncharacterized protein (TIGR02145 family)